MPKSITLSSPLSPQNVRLLDIDLLTVINNIILLNLSGDVQRM